MKPAAEAPSREKILFFIKTKGPQTAAQLARRLGVTPMAIRQHVAALTEDGLVEDDDGPTERKVGRPARVFRLTAKATERFPDSHAELAVGVLDAVRAAFGEEGVARLVAERNKRQLEVYGERLPDGPLDKRVAGLASIRRDEGYLAEWSRQRDGSLLLVENHCPICAAAETCQGLCAGELELFRDLLGDDVSVEREEHILGGDRRCAYRIRDESFEV